jgi:hypothetical protein
VLPLITTISVTAEDLRFVVDPNQSSSFFALASASQVDPFTGQFLNDEEYISGQTSAAAATAGIYIDGPEGAIIIDSDVSLATSPFEQGLMGVSGIGQVGIIEGDAASNSTGGSHVARIESSTLPVGTPVILTGTLTSSWNHGGDGDFHSHEC